MPPINNMKKTAQLGMPIGTATNRLRKKILFKFIQQLNLDVCFQCNESITEIDNLSIEHKIPWLDSNDPIGLFFDLDNIAFSHLSCNVSARKIPNKGNKMPHGVYSRYTTHDCRCEKCTNAKKIYMREYRSKN